MEANNASVPKPFPQSAQYKSSMDDVDDDGELEKPNLSQKPTQKKRKKKNAKKVRRAQLKHAAKEADPKQDEQPTEIKPAAEDETYSPTRYAQLRKQYIDKKRLGA